MDDHEYIRQVPAHLMLGENISTFVTFDDIKKFAEVALTSTANYPPYSCYWLIG
jgi:hypothetical protein